MTMMGMLTWLVQLSNSSSTAQLRGPARSVKLQVGSNKHTGLMLLLAIWPKAYLKMDLDVKADLNILNGSRHLHLHMLQAAATPLHLSTNASLARCNRDTRHGLLEHQTHVQPRGPGPCQRITSCGVQMVLEGGLAKLLHSGYMEFGMSCVLGLLNTSLVDDSKLPDLCHAVRLPSQILWQ